MENLPRSFKGIWVPKEIWLHPNLSCQEKCLWAEIDSLDREIEGCTASNEYLCKLFDLSERRLQECLSRLKNMGLIQYEKFDGRIRTLRSCVKTFYRTPEVQDREVRKTAPLECGKPHPSSHGPIYDRENSGENSSPSPTGSEKSVPPSDAREIAEYLWSKIKTVHPKAKTPDIKKWTEGVQKCLTTDRRSKNDMMEIIRFAFEEDPFWVKVIQSPDALRRNFDKIWVKKTPIENNGTRIQKNIEIAAKMKAALGSDNMLFINKNSITNMQTGDSISTDLQQETFVEVLLKWTGLERNS